MHNQLKPFISVILKYLVSILLLVNLGPFKPVIAQDIPFHRGVNLTSWFQVPAASQIQFTKYTKKDFEQIKSLGCDAIRLPINLHYMTNGAPDYIIDPLFFSLIDEVVAWSEELGIHLILDNHTFSPSVVTDPQIGVVLEKVWEQMAEHYKNSSDLVYYEILNEPHGIDDAIWNDIQIDVVNKIREVDTQHIIVVGPAGWNSYNNLDDMPLYEDDNLIYTFHFYDPFIFTHQGASWTDPSMAPLAGVPFPYEAGSMPAFPNELVSTWIESAFLNYQNDGTVAKVQSLLDIAVDFAVTRQVPLFCGEFGVFIPNSDNNDRIYWYEEVRSYLEQNGIGWTIWDYHGGFGLFEADGNDLFEHDLNVPLLEALGFTVPPQSDYVKEPDTTGIIIYMDYTGERIQNYGSGSQLINFYSTDLPNNDSYCLKWLEANQYQAIGFDFAPDKDLSYLVDNDYALDLFIRGNTPGIRFDLRFIDTKTSDINDHPWRMVYTIMEGDANWDHKWHHARILLKDFTEQGSWDGSWFGPQGDFDWSDVDLFEIVAEYQDLGQATFWFDNIIITDEDTAQVNEDAPFEEVLGFENLESFEQKIKIFPNPVADLLNIEINDSKPFLYILYDMTGKVVISSKASRKVTQDISNLKNGLYFLKIVREDKITFSDKIYKQ